MKKHNKIIAMSSLQHFGNIVNDLFNKREAALDRIEQKFLNEILNKVIKDTTSVINLYSTLDGDYLASIANFNEIIIDIFKIAKKYARYDMQITTEYLLTYLNKELKSHELCKYIDIRVSMIESTKPVKMSYL